MRTPSIVLCIAGVLSVACGGVLDEQASDSAHERLGYRASGVGGRGSDAEAGVLTAGMWRDLDQWEFWQALVDPQNEQWGGMPKLWGYDTSRRFAVVVSSGSAPAIDLLTELLDGEGTPVYAARTDNRGRAELFAGLVADDAGPYNVRVRQSDGSSLSVVSKPNSEPLYLQAESYDPPAAKLDIMLMIDTTGSMGDELRFLQTELDDVLKQVKSSLGQLDLRVSVNFYRDVEDSYVVRSNPFVSDFDAVTAQLKSESAGGGGDFPEAVDQAFADAVNNHEWSASARNRLLFFVLDAPPHHETAAISSVHQSTVAAASKGIRVIPIAASGIDKDTEFLLRFFAIATGGEYIFLTDDSGVGNEHLEPTVGEYEVRPLNKLLVERIVDAARRHTSSK